MTFLGQVTKNHCSRPRAEMGVAPLNTGYGYILCTPVILVQKHPKYHPQLSETLGKEMHTQFWPATLVKGLIQLNPS